MAKFYFTYGSSSDIQPYQGGWTEVKAEDMDQAKIIIRYDDRGIWKTENGQHGPWILVAEVDHG